MSELIPSRMRHALLLLPTVTLAVACNSSTASLIGSLESSYALDFGQQPLGQQAQKTLLISNGSGTTTHVTSVDPSTDPQFAVVLASGTVIPAQGVLNLPVMFTPQSSGAQSGTIVLHTDDAAVPTISLNLAGEGVTLECPTVTPQMLVFGNVEIGTTVSRVVTLTNGTASDCQVTPGMMQGPQAALFGLDTTTPFTLSAGGLVVLNVSYSPTVASALDTASFTLTSGTGVATVDISGGAVANCLQSSPTPLDFAFVQPGALRTLPLHLTNGCGTPIDVTSVGVGDAGASEVFSLPSQAWNGGILNPGISVDLAVAFAPPMLGKYIGEVDLGTGGDAGVVATLTGFGGGPAISCTPLALDFGTTAVGIPTSLPVTCENTGTDVPGHPEAGLVMSMLTSSSASFSGAVDPQSSPQPLAAGKSLRVNATYTPPVFNAETATLTLNSNATDGTEVAPPVVSLTGQSIVEGTCTYNLSPTALDFGQIVPGAPATSSFVISNTGTNECLVSGLGLGAATDPAFTLPDGPIVSERLSPPSTPPGPYPTQLFVRVTFTPEESGSYSGSVQFSISDPVAPQQTVDLSGVGGTSCFLLEPSLLDFGTVGISNGQFCNHGEKKKFVGVNGCAQAVTITLVTLEAMEPFSLVSESLPQTVAPGDTSAPFVVGFEQTEAAGTFSSELPVQTDLQPTPFGVQLQGTVINGNLLIDMFAGGPASFPLSGTPDPTTITVYVDGPPPAQTPDGGQSGVLIPPTTPAGGTNWTYDSPSNSLVPDPLNLDLATTDTLYVEYTLVCD
jgi:hypothetical protein